ncbi:MAG TPA: cytochrome c biogenesis protein CcdA [Bacteroidota bacterium]|nr:cytochrome c biogenesis protein CcdA [Bacteroidota bacterium]
MQNVGILTAFIFGLLSFVSPCVLPIVPGYISFISGVSLDEMKGVEQNRSALRSIILNSIFFIGGFTLVFVLLGATATTLGKAFNEYYATISKVAGVLIIVFGLHMMGLFKIKFLNYEQRFHVQQKKLGMLGSFLVGTAFAFGWTPCIGPVLAAILVIASRQDTVYKGIVLLGSYSLGLGIPFFLTGVSINMFFSMFNRIKKYFHAIEVVGGAMLVALGILIITNSLTILSSYFSRWLPFLNELS